MRYDNRNWHNHGGYMEMTAPSLNVNVTDEDESKENIVCENFNREYFYKTLSQNNYADISENTITELKEEEHKEPSVTEKVTIYSNIL